MYRGRVQQGQEVTVAVLVADSNGAPVAPDAAPTVRIYDSTGALVYSGSLPVQDRFGFTGWFSQQLFLDAQFPTGNYNAVIRWAVSGSQRSEVDRFEVLAGGNRQGSIVSMTYYKRPQADFVVQSTLAGAVLKGRNPSV